MAGPSFCRPIPEAIHSMNLELDCPNGGHFYVCQGNTTQFLGCCTEDPCADGTGDCPQAALRNASYSSADYDSIPEQACVASSLWYTCAATNPPFMGCCEANPCQDGGCFGANLTAARLSDNVTDASPFMTSEASSGGSRSALSTGAIVGIAVGSALAALGIGIVLFMLYQRPWDSKSNVARRDAYVVYAESISRLP
ncbi:hypothetical protein M406DRAFT_326759 [Cryphonectria parasitica EP155]|uniref:Uncharacterized protein n=1 Tax=Cryphonectria parasitica (strain ATCC 38755 / EP155) TaxID=660469 RepID=A0A9P4YEN5_CRYP1|nr:uncharacterized protein M406DRAFT_326759 [Cryphonectria parasitica EP155]KAF3771374.1 hypothetical protein M406DRAFT_326759 [Cryphonectria parasitica EP155]